MLYDLFYWDYLDWLGELFICLVPGGGFLCYPFLTYFLCKGLLERVYEH